MKMNNSFETKYSEPKYIASTPDNVMKIYFAGLASTDNEKQFCKHVEEECKKDKTLEFINTLKSEHNYYQIIDHLGKEIRKLMDKPHITNQITNYFNIRKIPIKPIGDDYYCRNNRICQRDNVTDFNSTERDCYEKLEGVIDSCISGSEDIKKDYDALIDIMTQHIKIPPIAKNVVILNGANRYWESNNEAKEMFIDRMLGFEDNSFHLYTHCEYCNNSDKMEKQRFKNMVDLGMMYIGTCDAQPYEKQNAVFYSDELFKKIRNIRIKNLKVHNSER